MLAAISGGHRPRGTANKPTWGITLPYHEKMTLEEKVTQAGKALAATPAGRRDPKTLLEYLG